MHSLKTSARRNSSSPVTFRANWQSEEWRSYSIGSDSVRQNARPWRARGVPIPNSLRMQSPRLNALAWRSNRFSTFWCPRSVDEVVVWWVRASSQPTQGKSRDASDPRDAAHRVNNVDVSDEQQSEIESGRQ